MESYKLGEVFIPVGLPEITFVVRENIERSIEAWKINKAKHLLIFGPSKSGKTSLWQRYIKPDDIIKIPCNSDRSLSDIYIDILAKLDAFYTSEKGSELATKLGFLSEIKALFGVFSAKGQVTVETNNKTADKQSSITEPPIVANTIIKFLKPSNKIIVLEDFHYANEKLKNLLSQDLKAFSDDKCPWIIVGIQHKTSNLLSYNIDLQERIAEIPVEGFTEKQLLQIIELGELALNIIFLESIKKRIIKESLGSASLLQNICQRICLIKKINETMYSQTMIDNENIVVQACKEIATDSKTYYERLIKNVARGGRSDGSTEKYKWFLKLVRDKDIPEYGIRNTEIFAYIKELGHESIEQGSVTSGLNYLPKLIQKLGFPSFFDYDIDTKQFFLLDKYIKFVFKWLPEMIDDLFSRIDEETA